MHRHVDRQRTLQTDLSRDALENGQSGEFEVRNRLLQYGLEDAIQIARLCTHGSLMLNAYFRLVRCFMNVGCNVPHQHTVGQAGRECALGLGCRISQKGRLATVLGTRRGIVTDCICMTDENMTLFLIFRGRYRKRARQCPVFAGQASDRNSRHFARTVFDRRFASCRGQCFRAFKKLGSRFRHSQQGFSFRGLFISSSDST
mmetsp:Transcript_12637/g.34933  ORF Transcript_12637/g.34933 Transcript_12637/m.34933 type:complete len:202 (+) Transcript_12637:1034-1639(+)